MTHVCPQANRGFTSSDEYDDQAEVEEETATHTAAFAAHVENTDVENPVVETPLHVENTNGQVQQQQEEEEVEVVTDGGPTTAVTTTVKRPAVTSENTHEQDEDVTVTGGKCLRFADPFTS